MEGTHSRAAWHSEVTPVHRNELHTVKNTEREAGSSKHKNKEMDILLSGLIDLHYVYVLKNLQVFQVKNKKQKNKIETKIVGVHTEIILDTQFHKCLRDSLYVWFQNFFTKINFLGILCFFFS